MQKKPLPAAYRRPPSPIGPGRHGKVSERCKTAQKQKIYRRSSNIQLESLHEEMGVPDTWLDERDVKHKGREPSLKIKEVKGGRKGLGTGQVSRRA
jgi:hypothetical protein